MLTAFSWGYAGWGQSVEYLLRMTAELERERGFAPPLFVDIRLEHDARAPGFRGGTFKRAAGARYWELPGLGNPRVVDGGPTRLAEPAAIADLLDLIEQRAAHRQRVIFFCACGSPERLDPLDPDDPCHRTLVRRRLLALAAHRGLQLAINEWPEWPERTRQLVHLTVTRAQLRKTRVSKAAKGKAAHLMPLSRSVDTLRLGELGHFSLALLHSDDSSALVVTGPPVRRVRGWRLPIYKGCAATDLRAAQRWARDKRSRLHLPQHRWGMSHRVLN